MKKNLLYFLLILINTSCKKQLIENPRSVLNPAAFFKSDEEAIAGVNGAYQQLYFLHGGGSTYDWDYLSELGTDLARPTGGREATFAFHVYTLGAANQTGFSDLWLRLYKGVGDCNLVISRLSGNSYVSESIGKRVVAEAVFLRSYYYYMLTCLWGDVPMWLNELDIDKIAGAIPRIPVSEVRKQMINDLEAATVDLPAVYETKDRGRASKWAAKMLLCKYYLWEKEFEKARQTAADIIAQQGGEHRLLDHYSDIWGEAKEYNPELIWEIDYVQDLNASNRNSRFVPRQVDEPVVAGYNLTGYGLLTATQEFLATFDPDDQRKQWYDWHGDGGVTTQFHYVAKNINWASPRGNSGLNAVVYRMADAYLMYAESENELNGPTEEAYTKINAIRARANVNALSGLTQVEFREAVMNERKWELGFEYHRRWDLNRWGKLVEAVQTQSATNPTGVQNVKSFHQLLPLPANEITLNPVLLPDNQGY